MTPMIRIALSTALTGLMAGITGAAFAQAEHPKPDKPTAGTTAGRIDAGWQRDRWLIKTASDAEAQEIDAKARASTVEKLPTISSMRA